MYENWIIRDDLDDMKAFNLAHLNRLITVFSNVMIDSVSILLWIDSDRFVRITNKKVKFSWDKRYSYTSIHITYDESIIKFTIYNGESGVCFSVEIKSED